MLQPISFFKRNDIPSQLFRFLYLNIFMPPRSYGILSLLFPSMWTALKSKHLKQSSRTFDDVSSTKLLVISYRVYTTWFRVTDSLYPNILSAACLMTWAPRLISSFVSWTLRVALILNKKKKKNTNSHIIH